MRNLLLFLIAALLLSACEVLDPSEEIPAYLEIKEARVLIDSTTGRTSTLGVKDLWIGRGGDAIGIHQVPFTIPIYPKEEESFVIAGGIFSSGLSILRETYPFWLPVQLEVAAEPGDTIRLSPVFEYYPDTILAYPFIEDFDDASIGLQQVNFGPNDVSLGRTNTNPFMGLFSGVAQFDSVKYKFEVVSDQMTLPQRGNNNVYIEMTYRNNVPFTVGFYYQTPSGDFGEGTEGLYYASGLDEWNTVYVNINNLIRQIENGAAFQIYLRANSQKGEGKIYVDNIRVVHFIP